MVGPSSQIAVGYPNRVTVFNHHGKEQWSEALNDSKDVVSSLIFRRQAPRRKLWHAFCDTYLQLRWGAPRLHPPR